MLVLTVLAGTLLLHPASYADDSDARVARVSYVSGDVSYQRGDVEGWNGLRVNTPLVTGDSFFVPDGGRAEVDLGSGIVVRVDGGTQVDLVNNARDIVQLGVSGGLLDLSAGSLPPAFELEIDTPNGAATILEPGRYRVEVTDHVATYSVVQGSVSVAVDGQQFDVGEGEGLELEDTDPPTYAYTTLGARTPFQGWSDERGNRFDRSSSAQYVNHDVVGYEDLDDHGTWRNSRDYGQVWVPSGMAQGWAPYQSGRWTWQDPYGWTWVSDESWGWAPYHYGRWIRTESDWGWVPPPRQDYRGPSVVMDIQAVYAPALVAFVGGRNWGASLSIGGPAIGWVPLAPAERYYYPWQSAPQATNHYTNITVVNAVTVVNYNTFATGEVRRIHVDQQQVEHAPVIGYTAVGVVPGRGSLVVSPERQGSRGAPRARIERPLVARLVPPPRQQQFAQKVAEIEKTGRPAARPVVRGGAVGTPFLRGVRAPAGVRAVSALAPEAPKDLRPRHDAEVRPPKRIERDIAPPARAARRGGQQRDRMPGGAAARTPGNDVRQTPPVTEALVRPPVTPEATPGPFVRPVQPEPRPFGRSNANRNRAPLDRQTESMPREQMSTPDVPRAPVPYVQPEASPAPGVPPAQPEPRPFGRSNANRNRAPRNRQTESMPREQMSAPAVPRAPVPYVQPEALPAPGVQPVRPGQRPAYRPNVRRAPAPGKDQMQPSPANPNKNKKSKPRGKHAPPPPPPAAPPAPSEGGLQ